MNTQSILRRIPSLKLKTQKTSLLPIQKLKSSLLFCCCLLFFAIQLSAKKSINSSINLAGNPAGDLRIEVLTAPNFIVDSNVESPSSYAPNSAHIGAQFCNDGTDTIFQVFMYIGDFAASTPGIYPSRTHAGLTGTFSMTHQGGAAGTNEAIRYIPYILPGECVNQYWLVTYPNLDDNGNSVTGGNSPDDDLWLEYDIWASGDDNGTQLTADQTSKATMRSEISAMANKIWPNGDNKVPTEYLNAIEDMLGWNLVSSSGNSSVYPGETFTLQGVWYDLGNVGSGFDNDGDFIPDRNIWMQPVGDASTYNPDCFRLVSTTGLVIVKKTDGTEELIPFRDKLYFSQLPEKNTGAVGLVYYEFAALNGPCNTNLTPYQEVASGNDNEKFNGDFGAYIPLAISEISGISFTKSVDKIKLSGTFPDTLSYSLDFSNNSPVAVGDPFLGIPYVIQDEIPDGTFYVAGSAEDGNTLPPSVGSYTVMYSIDEGDNWTNTEPATASTVTHLRWLLNNELPSGESGAVTLKVEVTSADSPIVCNVGESSYGFSTPFTESGVCTLSPGDNVLGDLVWEDDGGTTGTQANGIQDGDEVGIQNIEVSIYYDFNENGSLDAGDILWGKDTTDASGNYLFDDLPDGNFIVKIERTDVTELSAYTGWGATTATEFALPIDTANLSAISVSDLTSDFGFSPALTLNKTLASGTPVYEGSEVTFDLTVKNLLSNLDGSSSGLGEDAADALGKLFWSEYNYDPGTGSVDGIRRIDPSVGAASLTEIINTSTAENKTGTAIDLVNEHLYWVDDVSDEIKRSNLDGTNVITVLDLDPTGTINPNPYRIDLDLLNEKIYWTEQGTDKIRRANLDGSSPEDLYTVVGENLLSVALDVASHEMYYGTSNGVFKISMDGTGSPFTVIPNQNPNEPVDLELDLTNGKLYQTDYGSGQIEIQRVNFDGTNLEDVWAGGLPKASGIALDVPNDQLYFTVSGNKTNIYVSPLAGSSAGTADIFLDVSGDMDDIDFAYVQPYMEPLFATEFNIFTSLLPVPLFDSFPGDSLEFISATIAPDSVNQTTGKLFWDNIGPVNAGDSVTVSVTFKAKKFLSTTSGLMTNTATTTGATFATGDPANSDTDDAQITILPTGTISGYVWSDADSDGWQGSVGYEAGESFVPNAQVVLHTCTGTPANNGSCSGTTTDTLLTDANGYYIFEALLPNQHYSVELIETSLPGTISQSADPDDDPNGSSGGNGGNCGSNNRDVDCNANWDVEGDWFELGADTWDGESWDPEDINFGYSINPALYGNVWEDINGDGVQSAGENGFLGVTVYLQSGSCTPGTNCPSTTTDANGDYIFENLSASTNYNIIVGETTLPAIGTWTETAETDGSINNSISKILTGGEISGSHNFGYTATGTGAIGDTIYYDFNGSGTYNNEEVIPNVVIWLYRDVDADGVFTDGTDVYISADTTDANGAYLFNNLPSGEYLVQVQETANGFPTDVTQTADPTESGKCVSCDAIGASTINMTTDLTVDFGYQPYGSASLGDLVWFDSNGDSTQLGTAEIGFENIKIELWADLNGDGIFNLVDMVLTDSMGAYLFENLPDGDYKVVVDSTDSDIPVDAFGNSYSPSTAMQYEAEILNNEIVSIDGIACTDCNLNFDFGFLRLGSIGDMIFWDANANGELDWSDSGIPGITVYLLDSLGVKIDSTITSDGTDGNDVGFYIFSGLPPSDYTAQVKTSDLNGAILTADPSADGVVCTDPTAVGCDDEYETYIGYGTNFVGADFGYKPAGVIGDFIWFDQDGDGIQDSGEPGIVDVQVILTNQISVTIDGVFYAVGTYKDTVFTDIDGNYFYQNLPDGTYSVDIPAPAGMSITSGAESIGALTTNVIMSGGEVISVSGNACIDCDLTVDFGFEMVGPYMLSGSICMEDDANIDGVCGGAGDSQMDSLTVYLYNDAGDFLGSTQTDLSGNYSFGNLIADTYIVALSTAIPELEYAALTTTAANTPATSITETEFSTYQTVPLSANVIGVDFAYELTVDFDYGDLPDDYKTSFSMNGPRHTVPASPTIYLGSSIDTESDGNPSAVADSDGADEDGVVFNNPETWTAGTVASGNGGSITVTVTGTGYLVGWIDFTQDNFLVNDMAIDTALAAGSHILAFDILDTATLADKTFFSRFRFFETEPAFPAFTFCGSAEGGEVEDYTFSTTLNPCPDPGVDVTLNCPGSGGNAPETYDFALSGTWSVISEPSGTSSAVSSAGVVTGMTKIGDYIFQVTDTSCPDEQVTITRPDCCPPASCVPLDIFRFKGE